MRGRPRLCLQNNERCHRWHNFSCPKNGDGGDLRLGLGANIGNLTRLTELTDVATAAVRSTDEALYAATSAKYAGTQQWHRCLHARNVSAASVIRRTTCAESAPTECRRSPVGAHALLVLQAHGRLPQAARFSTASPC